MKLIHNASRRILVLALLLTFANAFHWFWPTVLQIPHLTLMNMLGGMVLALEGLLLCKRVSVHRTAALAAPAPVLSRVSRDERSRHELAAFLGLLQEKGRLVDFLMEDITSQPDDRVGQIARVVHQGCSGVIRKHFDLSPVTDTPEGAALTLDKGYPPGDYRLVGTVSGEPPHRGTVLHPGWKTSRVALPELLGDPPESTDAYLVAPAELELS